MPSTTLPAAAPGLPLATRRRALATLAAAGAALTIPKVAHAMPAPSPDAELIALADRAMALNEAHDAALDREVAIEDRLFSAPRPDRPADPVLTGDTVDIEHFPDGSFVLRSTRPPAEAIAANTAAREAHAQAMAAWDFECEDRKRRSGLKAAQRASRRADRRLTAAGVALTAMRATTLPGIAVKARVSLAVNPDRAYSTRWMADLAASVTADLMAAGGAA